MTPSGADAQFIPILIAKMLNTESDNFLNIITAQGEIGSSTVLAAAGKYISYKEPMEGYATDLKKDQGTNGKWNRPNLAIDGLSEGLEVLALNARDEEGNFK